jgi:hypothetical protein
MTDVIFVRTRHNYESYVDFWSLVELSGFPFVYVDQVDISQDAIYIISPMNGEWRAHINNQHRDRKIVNAHLILWNLERPSGSAGSIGHYGSQCRYLQHGLWENGKKVNQNGEESYGRFLDEIWVSDSRLADETGTRFVILGSHEDLGSPGNDKSYDLVHMSYETNRRQTIYKKFNQDRIAPNCWGERRDQALKASKFALNIHQDQHPFQEPLRFALFAAYGLPIVSEVCFDGFPWEEERTIIFNPYDGIVGKLHQMLDNDYGRWRDMGLRARDMMTKRYTFEKSVKEAVKEIARRWR